MKVFSSFLEAFDWYFANAHGPMETLYFEQYPSTISPGNAWPIGESKVVRQLFGC